MLKGKESIENRIQYTGQQYGQETGQYYLRARFYNLVIGRFTQEDAYRGDGLNLYAYCGNNPVMYYDPSGHEGMAYSDDPSAGSGQSRVEQVDAEVDNGVNAGLDFEGGLEPDFYVGPNGKVLPSQYKDWIGTNIQKELLDQAENPQLQNAIKQLYRENSFIGDGGTADIIRFEQQTGLMLGKNGGSHVQKGIDMAKYIENKILIQDLSPSDRTLATQLLEDLYNALGR